MAELAKEVFKDYTEQNIILEAQIDNVNLFKKSNILEINLTSENKISIRDLFSFEIYLKKRFNLSGIKLNINYTKSIDFSIEDEWEDIAKYVIYKYPSTKAIFANTKIDVQDKNIIINLSVKGKEILETRGIDKAIERIIEVLYNKKCNVKFDETNQNEEEQIEYLKHLEDIAIESAKKEMQERQINEPISLQEKKEEKKERNPIIYGKVNKTKVESVKIKDITEEPGKISIQGEITPELVTDAKDSKFELVQSRLTKTGKSMITFNVYDGTNTITCKIFCAPEKEKEIVTRLKDAESIQVIGTVQFDMYKKEIGIMANTIIESRSDTKGKKTR